MLNVIFWTEQARVLATNEIKFLYNRIRGMLEFIKILFRNV